MAARFDMTITTPRDGTVATTSVTPPRLRYRNGCWACWASISFTTWWKSTFLATTITGERNPDADNDLLRQLSGFPDLRRLELTHCGITDEGLQHLPTFAHLEALELSYSSVADDGLPYIGRLNSLTSLNLGHTRVTGRGFHRLAELERLEVLILTLTPIRDKALSSVEPLQRLRYVHVHGCRHLTRGSVAAFRQALPACELRGTASLERLWKRAADESTSPARQ
jgi:hypothetical protein